MKAKVIEVLSEQIKFDNGATLFSNHDQDCCENHYLSFAHIELSDFDGLEFDLSGDTFFKRVEGYGIELIPINGHPVRVPGYGSNNGYYSTQLDLILEDSEGKRIFRYDITECQNITD